MTIEITPSHIDNRQIKCHCGDANCKIGLNLDSDEKQDFLLLTDKYGNEHIMHLSKHNVSELQQYLIEVKKRM